MIIASSRSLQSSTRNKLQSVLNSLVVTSYSASAMPPPLSLSTDTPTPPPPKSSEWSGIFCEENKRRAIELLSADRDNFSFRKFGKSCRKAAILVPFCFDVHGRPGLIYNLRSEKLSTHKGEISFPGGTLDPEDNDDPIAAALRETHEELGISKDQVDIWTTCRVFSTVSSSMGVVPVVGFINSGPVDPERLEINPDEVDHAFVIPLEHLCDPSNWTETEPPYRPESVSIKLPVYQNMHEISEGLQGVHLWGLTAFITHLVLTAFIPQKYTRTISFITLNLDKTEKPDKSLSDAKTSSNKPSSKL